MTSYAPYRLVRPCRDCPFRTGPEAIRLSHERAQGIATYLTSNDGNFHCHATTTTDEDSGESVVTATTSACAGSLIMLEREGVTTQMMRIGRRCGVYDPERLDMSSPVFDTLDAWVAANTL